jgi:hypothetical protein
MTRQEWIDNDNSFYHITHTRNLQSIINSGLENRNGRGICVVRTNDERIVKYICQMMLLTDDDLDFSVIEIIPSRINLQATEILIDGVTECTDPLHNYINRENIPVAKENVIGTYCANSLGIADLNKYELTLRQEFNLEQLT